MYPERLPLSRRPAVRTHSIEEARVAYSRFSLPVRLDQASRRRFAWEGNYATLGPLTLSAHRFADAFTATSESVRDTLVLTIPIGAGVGECHYGRAEVLHVPGRTGGLSSGGEPVTMRTSDAYGSMSVHVPAVAMQDAAFALTGEMPKRPPRFAPCLDLRSPTMASLLRTVRYAFEEADDPEGLASTTPVGERIAEALLFGLLLSQPQLDHVEDRDFPRDGTPRHVRRAVEFLEANAARPIRLAEVAAVAGIGVRALQNAFRSYRGASPMAYLRAHRLAHARRRLLARDDASIAQIAIDCGFTHLGRFGVAYRAAYGESPSATRARASGEKPRG